MSKTLQFRTVYKDDGDHVTRCRHYRAYKPYWTVKFLTLKGAIRQ